VTSFEGLAIGYFALVAATGWHASRRGRGLLLSAGAIGLVIVARFVGWDARAWLPHAYLLLGYWTPAAFMPPHPDPRVERWLAGWGWRRPCGTRVSETRRTPATIAVLELAYLLCYPLVPAAFGVVFFTGDRCDVARFWTAVLAAGFLCYVTLPWMPARPPRLIDGVSPPAGGLAALNSRVLAAFSHERVTFPSGHVAVAAAAAVAVARVHPGAGVVMGLMAVLIAVAAVAGRYHYPIDVVLGTLVGIAAPVITGVFE
jgi:membrane-associated phospholipid phosphatase